MTYGYTDPAPPRVSATRTTLERSDGPQRARTPWTPRQLAHALISLAYQGDDAC